jgi:hypothetical protein
MIPFGITAVVLTLFLIYVGLAASAYTGPIEPTFWIGPVVVLLALLGGSLLFAPALVFDAQPTDAVLRAARTMWRPALAVALAASYVGVLTVATWLGPDQLLALGLIAESEMTLFRAVATWLAVGAVAIPFWRLVARLYVAP